MNDVLSTMIAFVGFVIIFSTLVQAVQEALKSVLKLKTGVWQRFFTSIYKKEFPSQGIETSTKKRIISYWKRVRSGEVIGEFEQKSKRLRAIVEKSGVSLKKLREAIIGMTAIVPQSPEFSKEVAIKGAPFAEALRELIGYRLDALLNIFDRYSGNKIAAFYKELHLLEDALQNQNVLASEKIAEFQRQANKFLEKIDDIERRIASYRQQIEDKMDFWLAQVNEEYKRNMLKWTVLIGAFFVIVFNADSFTIYRHLGVDSKARSALLEKVAETTASTQQANADDLLEIESAIKNHNLEKAKTAAVTLAAGLQKDFETLGASYKAGEAQKLRDEVERINLKETKAEELLRDKEGDLSRLFIGLKKGVIDYQIGDIASLDLPLGWTSDWKALGAAKGSAFVALSVKKIGGLALTIFLITFGAPFWNNILSVLVGIKTKALSKKEG